MSTQPMKALVALASFALLGSLVGGGSAPAMASGCTLDLELGPGSSDPGTADNRWLVRSGTDFGKVGKGGCGLDRDYLQTASFSVDTSNSAQRVDDIDDAGTITGFSGVYDGGHWTITLVGDSNRSVFSTVSGTVKKLRLAGELQDTRTGATQPGDEGLGSVANFLLGGTISEVGSTVTIRSSVTGASSGAEIGGLIGFSKGDSLIQYSFYSGKIELALNPVASGASVGGLVGRGQDLLRIRDSYSRAQIEYDETASVKVGGIVGYFAASNPPADNLNVVRTYSAGSFTVGELCALPCDPENTYVDVGGLLGEVNMTYVHFVSSFWLDSTPLAVGKPRGSNSQPPSYNPDNAPVAVKVSEQTLRAISTFQSKGVNGSPNVGDSLPTGDSTPNATPSLSINDYRWAIEPGNVEGFVAQKRVASPALVGETVTFTRAFDRLRWTNSTVPPATYTTRGVSETVTGYPALGRVWEICSNQGVNNGFPVLVWEQRNCPSEGTGGGGTDRNRDRPADTELAAALAAGLSGAELQAFLASGLTLEEWLAQRLAATGTPGEAFRLGVAIAGMLVVVGLGLMVARRRLGAIGGR